MDTWRDVDHDKSCKTKKGLRAGKYLIFLLVHVRVRVRERERERGEPRASFRDLWSSVGRNSLSQEQKFIVSTKAMCGYQKFLSRGEECKTLEKSSFSERCQNSKFPKQ